MALVETLKIWDSAVTELDQQNVATALTSFKEISEPSSRIIFNIACCYELLGRLTDALAGLDDAISRDNHFVVAYFQRASIKFQLNRFKDAVDDFDLCHKKMMDKKFIDYGQLGLRYKLHSCEPLYNAGVVLLHSKDMVRAMDYLLQAQKGKCESRHSAIDSTLELLNSQFNNRGHADFSSVKLMQLPPDGVFRPPKSKVANMNEIQFLKKAKVVAATSENDTFTGFVGRKRLEESGLAATLSAPNSPLSPRRNANKSPTAEAGKLAKERKSKSPNPPSNRVSTPSDRRPVPPVPKSSTMPPPNKPLPPPPQKALPVPPGGRKSTDAGRGPPQLPSRTAPELPGKADVRPKQFNSKPAPDIAGELQKSLAKMNVGGQSQRTGAAKPLPVKPGAGARNGVPPRPPKVELRKESGKRRSNVTSVRGSVNKAAAPEPPPVTAGGALSSAVYEEKPDPNLVTIDLNCYSTVSIKVDRDTCLKNLLDVAASISDFDLDPGTFNLWCVGPENEQICIENEDMMKMLWTEKEDENYIALWCYAMQ